MEDKERKIIVILVSEMITNGKYILRKGVKGDRPATNYVGAIILRRGETIHENIPDYVLLYENQQIGALHGDAGSIRHIEIFDEFQKRGHAEKFVGLLELEAKNLGLTSMEAYPVTNPIFAHVLEKRQFELIKEEADGTRIYTKKLVLSK